MQTTKISIGLKWSLETSPKLWKALEHSVEAAVMPDETIEDASRSLYQRVYGELAELWERFNEHGPATVTNEALTDVSNHPTEQPNTKPITSQDEGSNQRATEKQISAIFGVAKGNGWENGVVKDMCFQRYGKPIDSLTKREASSFITSIKGR